MATTLWHVTSMEKCEQILDSGFRDGPFRENPKLQGVYLSDYPTWDGMTNNVPEGWAAIAVVFEESEKQLADYSVSEEGNSNQYREWFIPAPNVNRATPYFVRKDQQE